MKFGKYLEQTSVPEWRHAYIDYKRMKRYIKSLVITPEPEKSRLFVSQLCAELSKATHFYLQSKSKITNTFFRLNSTIDTNNKQKLKKSLRILYKYCDFVENFQILNRIALTKLTKKFDKRFGCSTQDDFLPYVYLPPSDTIKDVKIHIIDLLTLHVYDGDRKQTMSRLRMQQSTKRTAKTFRVGLFLGMSILLITHIFYRIITRKMYTAEWAMILYIYGGLFIVNLSILGLAIDMWIWSHKRINYIFIMDLDTNWSLQHSELAELGMLMTLTLSTFAFVTFFELTNISMYIPIICCSFYILLTINPLDVMHRKSRFYFIKLMIRIFFAGFSQVTFAEFFVADLLLSLTFFWTALYSSMCFYTSSKFTFSEIEKTCDVKKSWISACLISLPVLVRIIQCIRMYYDHKRVLHLVNATKYFMMMCFVYAGILRARNTSSLVLVLWILVAASSSLYAFLWDILRDWNVNRTDIMFSKRIVISIVVADICLRITWILTLSPSFILSNYVLAFTLACLEVFRRHMWAVFRMEHEHSHNVENFRAVEEIPF